MKLNLGVSSVKKLSEVAGVIYDEKTKSRSASFAQVARRKRKKNLLVVKTCDQD